MIDIINHVYAIENVYQTLSLKFQLLGPSDSNEQYYEMKTRNVANKQIRSQLKVASQVLHPTDIA